MDKRVKIRTRTWKNIPYRVIIHVIFPYLAINKSQLGPNLLIDIYGYFKRDPCRKFFRLWDNISLRICRRDIYNFRSILEYSVVATHTYIYNIKTDKCIHACVL